MASRWGSNNIFYNLFPYLLQKAKETIPLDIVFVPVDMAERKISLKNNNLMFELPSLPILSIQPVESTLRMCFQQPTLRKLEIVAHSLFECIRFQHLFVTPMSRYVRNHFILCLFHILSNQARQSILNERDYPLIR